MRQHQRTNCKLATRKKGKGGKGNFKLTTRNKENGGKWRSL